MTEDIKRASKRVPGYNEDFYTDNRISRGRTSSTRVFGSRQAGAFDKGERPKQSDNNSERVARRGKAKVGEARREAGQRKKFVERRRGLILAVILILFFALTIGTIYKLVFVVKSINITGSLRYTNEEIIESSGISAGVNLYSFRASSVVNSLTLKCPYIRDVVLERRVPSTVNITAEEDIPAYYAVIYGEYKILSEGLRVLETVDTEAIPEGIPKLKLPTVSYAVAGRKLEFESEKRENEIYEILKTVRASELASRLTVIDLRDRYDISMICDGKNKLILGENTDVDYKLRVAAKVLLDEMFTTDNKFRVDLTVRGKTGVIMDNLLDVN